MCDLIFSTSVLSALQAALQAQSYHLTRAPWFNSPAFAPGKGINGFQSPGKFCFWNPESLAFDSGIQLKEYGTESRIHS